MSLTMSPQVSADKKTAENDRFLLWIDGVGGYLLTLSQRLTIGGPADGPQAADLTLLANLSRKHATLFRSGEGYLLDPHGPTCIGDRQVTEETALADGYEIRLGANVRLRFRLPSVLSGTAVLDFFSDHRPANSVDGVIMMQDNCLLGPGSENHVTCPDASESVVLFRRDQQFWVKTRSAVSIDERLSSAGGPIHPGSIVTTTEIRFRLERAP